MCRMHALWTALIHADAIALIKLGGYAGIAFMVFAESGLLFGIIFPGDSLLFSAGLLASAGFLAPVPLMLVVIAASALGGFAGYALGAVAGPRLFAREDALIFKRRYVDETRAFFDTYGARAVLFARFVPVVRAFLPAIAGMAGMDFARFSLYTILGSAAWGAGVVALGCFLGSLVPASQHYVLPLSLLIIVLSLLPAAYHFLRRARR